MSDAVPPGSDQDETRLGNDDLTEAGAPEGEAPALKRLGDFELVREIGRGGMGVVYEARQVSLKRRVALKVLPPALGMGSQAKLRFEREAQAAAKLHHTNIVPVHAIGEHDGHHFYAMDLIEGQSLDHLLLDVVEHGSKPLAETVTRAAPVLPKRPKAPTESNAWTTSAGDSTTSLGETSAGSRAWVDGVAKLIEEVADALSDGCRCSASPRNTVPVRFRNWSLQMQTPEDPQIRRWRTKMRGQDRARTESVLADSGAPHHSWNCQTLGASRQSPGGSRLR